MCPNDWTWVMTLKTVFLLVFKFKIIIMVSKIVLKSSIILETKNNSNIDGDIAKSNISVRSRHLDAREVIGSIIKNFPKTQPKFSQKPNHEFRILNFKIIYQ